MGGLVRGEGESPIKESDFGEISFSGTIEGSEEPPVTAQKAVAEIGGRNTLKEFSENLLGAKVNEEKPFTVQYRADYPEPKLAGRTVEYKLKVEAIKQKEVPEINDEFAQRLGDYKTVDELKAKVRNDIEKYKHEHAHEEMREKLLEWLQKQK